jgi:hypothetical protein
MLLALLPVALASAVVLGPNSATPPWSASLLPVTSFCNSACSSRIRCLDRQLAFRLFSNQTKDSPPPGFGITEWEEVWEHALAMAKSFGISGY